VNLLLSFRVSTNVSCINSADKVVYPQSTHWRPLDQFQVLESMLESYSALYFERAYVFIDVSDNTQFEAQVLHNVVKKYIRATILSISLTRPDTKRQWLEVLKTIEDQSEPYIVSMNHDQLLKGSAQGFEYLVSKCYNEITNDRALLTFTHIPEYVATAKLNIFGYDFRKDGLFYIDRGPRKWIDCVFVMSIKTLIYIFEGVLADGPDYLPRFDWDGVKFDWLDVKTIVFPFEFFQHYDGSTHVLCSRLLEKLNYSQEVNTLVGQENLFYTFVKLYHIYWAKYIASCKTKLRLRDRFAKVYSECVDEYVTAISFLQPVNVSNKSFEVFFRNARFYQEICFYDSYLDSYLIDKQKLPRSFPKARKFLRSIIC
jgi:hypothetical protein